MQTNKEIAKRLRKTYSVWKKDSLSESGFFPIFNGFVGNNKLNALSGGALKLYVYLGLYANNNTGEVWHSNKKIAQYFNKNERTIRMWMHELENYNLIQRMQLEYDGEPHVFLLPYFSTSNYDNIEKYVYTYRLKDKLFRDMFDLREFSNDITAVLEKNISHTYVSVKKKTFTITSYTALSLTTLKSVNKLLLKGIPDLYLLCNNNSYINKNEKEVNNAVLFEQIRNK